MQSPPKTAVFESDLAPLLSAFVAEKQRFGFKYNSIEAYLKSFDTFLLGRDCKNSLSKELMLEWIAPKAHQKSATIEHRIYIMQRLADFLNRNGFSAALECSLMGCRIYPQRTSAHNNAAASRNTLCYNLRGFKSVRRCLSCADRTEG